MIDKAREMNIRSRASERSKGPVLHLNPTIIFLLLAFSFCFALPSRPARLPMVEAVSSMSGSVRGATSGLATHAACTAPNAPPAERRSKRKDNEIIQVQPEVKRQGREAKESSSSHVKDRKSATEELFSDQGKSKDLNKRKCSRRKEVMQSSGWLGVIVLVRLPFLKDLLNKQQVQTEVKRQGREAKESSSSHVKDRKSATEELFSDQGKSKDLNKRKCSRRKEVMQSSGWLGVIVLVRLPFLKDLLNKQEHAQRADSRFSQ